MTALSANAAKPALFDPMLVVTCCSWLERDIALRVWWSTRQARPGVAIITILNMRSCQLTYDSHGPGDIALTVEQLVELGVFLRACARPSRRTLVAPSCGIVHRLNTVEARKLSTKLSAWFNERITP